MALYVAVLALIWAANQWGPDRWWWSALNLYLPQWIWGVPGLVLTALCARFARRLAWLPALCVLWVAGPMMDLQVHGAPPTPGPGQRLRLMTYNIKWGLRDGGAALREVAQAKPDLFVAQDANDSLVWFLRRVLPGFHVRSVRQYVVASRFPILKVEERKLSPPNTPGPVYSYLRCHLWIDHRVVTLANVHLITPRAGLTSVRHEWEEGIPVLRGNMAARMDQAARLATELGREEGPLIAAGDFNAPMASKVCKDLVALGLRDAFSQVGRGYGYTYGHYVRLRHSYLRIDHIFTNSSFTLLRCYTGGAQGSDHRPVIADMVLNAP